MNSNRWMIVVFSLMAIACYLIYQEAKVPDGVTPMGDKEDIAFLTYAGGAFAFVAAIIGLIREVVGLIRDVRKEND